MVRLLLTLLFTIPLSAAWTNVQAVQGSLCSSSTNPCTVTVTSTGAGHSGMVIGVNTTTTGAISSVSGGGTWTHPAGCVATNSTSGSTDVAYILSLTGGATTISVTWSNTGVFSQVYFVEFSSTGTPAFDVCGQINITTGTFVNPTLTLGGTSDVIASGINPNNSCSAIGSSYTGSFTSGVGMAYKVTNSGTAATWTCTGTLAAASAIALKDNTGGAQVNMPPRVL